MQFELTPTGIHRIGGEERQTAEGPALFLGVQTTGEGGDPSGNAPPPEPRAIPGVVPNAELLQRYGAPAPVVQRPTPAKIGPGDIVRAAKRRCKELRAEIREMRRLEKEYEQLRRLIAAAEGKPSAAVRSIDSSRRTG